MPLSDYSHHNEDAVAVWWAEEGSQHTYHEDDPYDEEEPDLDDDGNVVELGHLTEENDEPLIDPFE